jgi:hypothetical protein
MILGRMNVAPPPHRSDASDPDQAASLASLATGIVHSTPQFPALEVEAVNLRPFRWRTERQRESGIVLPHLQDAITYTWPFADYSCSTHRSFPDIVYERLRP